MKYNYYLTVCILILSNQLWSQTETCLQNINHPNYHTISQVTGSETISREYILHVPENYNENIPTPLLINMHGFGDCASDYSELVGSFYGLNALANNENFIIAYPQGAYRPEKEDTYWEPGDNGIDNIFENDVYFIEELINDIANEYNLNQEMIFACGYSNGGMMSYSLACNRSNLFSAIGIMSGVMLEESCAIDEGVPIIKFHGIADAVLPYNGSIWYQSVEDVINFWLDQNNINSSSLISSELNEGKVILDEYSGGNYNSCIDLYTINEEFDKPGDHVWFSEEIAGITPNEIMWSFFKNNCALTGTTSVSSKDLYEIYPNPVNQKMVINNAINQDYYINDLNGKLVLNGKIKSNKETISMEVLTHGFYTIRIGAQTNKFLKVE